LIGGVSIFWLVAKYPKTIPARAEINTHKIKNSIHASIVAVPFSNRDKTRYRYFSFSRSRSVENRRPTATRRVAQQLQSFSICSLVSPLIVYSAAPALKIGGHTASIFGISTAGQQENQGENECFSVHVESVSNTYHDVKKNLPFEAGPGQIDK